MLLSDLKMNFAAFPTADMMRSRPHARWQWSRFAATCEAIANVIGRDKLNELRKGDRTLYCALASGGHVTPAADKGSCTLIQLI